jgi:hypothetical protein
VKVELNRDWSEFLQLLISHRVRFLLVGGHAVAGHAEPRLTEDLDIFVEPTQTNQRGSGPRSSLFGFGESAPSEDTLAEPGKIFMLGRKPWRIDLLTAIDGVSFAEAWRTRVRADFVAGSLNVIGRDALIKNKRVSGRPKDLADVEALERAPAPKPRARKPAATANSGSKPRARRRARR